MTEEEEEKDGLEGQNLFKCGNEECGFSGETVSDFRYEIRVRIEFEFRIEFQNPIRISNRFRIILSNE